MLFTKGRQYSTYIPYVEFCHTHLGKKNDANRHNLMIFCLKGIDKTCRNFAKNAAIIKMNTFLKSGIDLDLSDILLEYQI